MKRITVLLGLVLFSLTVLTTSCSGPSTPGDTLKNFSYAMEKGDIDEVISMFGAGEDEMTEEEKAKLESLIKAGQEEIEKKGGIKSIEIIEEKISDDGETAKVKSKTTFGDGTEDEGSSSFILVDGDWKVSF